MVAGQEPGRWSELTGRIADDPLRMFMILSMTRSVQNITVGDGANYLRLELITVIHQHSKHRIEELVSARVEVTMRVTDTIHEAVPTLVEDVQLQRAIVTIKMYGISILVRSELGRDAVTELLKIVLLTEIEPFHQHDIDFGYRDEIRCGGIHHGKLVVGKVVSGSGIFPDTLVM